MDAVDMTTVYHCSVIAYAYDAILLIFCEVLYASNMIRMAPHISPVRADYGVPFVSSKFDIRLIPGIAVLMQIRVFPRYIYRASALLEAK